MNLFPLAMTIQRLPVFTAAATLAAATFSVFAPATPAFAQSAPVFATPQATNASAPEAYSPSPAEKAAWDKLIARGVEKIVFVKRFTYNGNHYYTEFLNSRWMPGGNLCLLDLKAATVTALVPSLTGGVFGAFDVSYDAKRIVFAYKAAKDVGYRLYEVNADGTGLRSVTVAPADEAAIVARYKIAGYHHGTEDLDPCYLPDGGIAFISTRCHFGILCDAPDIFPTTVLYRIDADGKNLRKLSNSSVSENSPVVLADGRILYTRWEYVDKGAVSVKCLWAMNPDGSNSVEIYGNDVAFPTTMIFARPIPDSRNEFVFTGTPHCPQNCVGTVVRIDTTKDIRTREPMTYITPEVDIREERGFDFLKPGWEGFDFLKNPADPDSGWQRDRTGKSGRLFRETYPLSRSEFLVSHKPAGLVWSDPKGYQLSLLNDSGVATPLYNAKDISAFRPIPLLPRKTPPVLSAGRDEALAAKNLAECIVTDVYRGMVGVAPGSIKYLRVLEQIPRPWGARRVYSGDEYDQQHAVITKDTHLGLKVQHGLVTVEADGSARFVVPAERNIFLQALDANYRAVQTERTYVNYMPGEVRSCVGCHESTAQSPSGTNRATPLAIKRKAEVPFAQPGEKEAFRTLSYARDVQPVWDKHCVSCHNSERKLGKLNLSGKQTALFNESYEELVPERRKGRGNYDKKLLGPVIGENHPKTGNIHYLPAKSLGSHASILAAMLSPDIQLADPVAQKRAASLAQRHKRIKLTQEELLRVTNWIDTNAQYYGTYFGRRNSKRYRNHPDYRTEYDALTALSPEAPVSVRNTSVKNVAAK
ncbi:MAG: hypothetical protein LBT53_08530 [Puniceicoccales bacterium]|nr:hypothetical protein [Puniceicoccales bacterium]